MNEPIRLPPDEPIKPLANEDFDGCIIIKAADGTPMIPMLDAKDFQPIVLTCVPTDGILVETQSLGLVEDFELGNTALVCGYGFPDSTDEFGEDE